MNTPHGSLLGNHTAYPQRYSPELLFAIPRVDSRVALGIEGGLPFQGVDVWTAYELSWLNKMGKPQVAIGEFLVPCESPAIIESKSLKLYLNSLNQGQFGSIEDVSAVLKQDLSNIAGAEVSVNLRTLNSERWEEHDLSGYSCLDHLDVDCTDLVYDPELLIIKGNDLGKQGYRSDLLKSNCPVTGQPDWASVYIECAGPQIAPESLLRYLVSFRQHQEFHEQCVERIFIDLQRIGMTELTVQARYLRRGGLDINPLRSNAEHFSIIGRTIRQ